MSPRSQAWLLFFAAVIAAIVGATRLEIVADIRHFIPDGSDSGLSTVSAELARSPLTRTSTIALTGARAIEAAPLFRSCVEMDPGVEWVRSGVDTETEQVTYDLLFPRRLYLRAPPPPEEGAVRLKETLAGPKGSLLRPLLPRDPLLLYPDLLEGLRSSERLRVEAGQFVTDDRSAAILFVRTRASAFDAAAQRDFQGLLAECLERAGDGVTLRQSGLGRFAMVAEGRTRSDVTRVSIASTVAIIATFLLLFGRVRIILLAFAPVVFGFAFGLAGTVLVTPRLHGISLAFGSALLGVGVDYAIHLLFHLDRRGHQSVATIVERVRPGLVLGATTTAVGLAGIALTTFPGMRELALLGSLGIAGSLAATLVLVPSFAADLPPRRVRSRWIDRCGIVLDWVERRERRMGVLFGALVLAGAVGAATVEWSDGLRALYEVDPKMLAEDEEVRALTNTAPLSRMVLASGDTLEDALSRNDQVHEVLAAGRADGEIEGFRSVHSLLPARSTQLANLERIRSKDYRSQLRAALAREGFVATAFRPFFDDLADPPAPLTFEDYAGTPFEQIIEPFVLHTDSEFVVVTWLRGAPSEPLRARLATLEGVRLFDQQRFLDEAYGRYRAEMVRMLLVGLGAVGLVILLWYRSWRVALAAFLPAVAGAGGALAAAAWFDSSANLVHAASLLLVCSMGADYGIFMVESRGDREHRATTLAGATASALTTILSFGLLAMSDNPALASVGRSVVIGVVCALLTSPVATLLSPARQR